MYECLKMNRITRFYTGQEVTVLDINGGNFFSPHPVNILTKEEQLKVFLKDQQKTFAIVKKGGKKAIEALPINEFQVHFIRKSGEYSIFVVEAMKESLLST